MQDPDITLGALAAFPEGTLGHAIRAYMVERQLDPGVEMHDAIHVMTGLPTTRYGEECALVHDLVLRNVNEMTPERLKLEIGSYQGRSPFIAERYGIAEPSSVIVPDTSEIEVHYELALGMRKQIKEKTGKFFHEMDWREQCALPMQLFEEYKEAAQMISRHLKDLRRTIPSGTILRS